MKTHIFRPLLPTNSINEPFSMHYVFNCGKYKRPIIIYPDSNMLIETDKVLASAEHSQLSVVQKAYLYGSVWCLTQGYEPPELIILPLILGVEGLEHFYQQYLANFKKLYCYFGVSEEQYDFDEIFLGLFSHIKSPIGLKDTPLKAHFMDTYALTLLMLYSVKRYEYGKNVFPALPDGIQSAVYDQLYWTDMLDATTLRLMQYYFSPDFSCLPRKSADGKFKRNFFKKIAQLNSDNWQDYQKTVWNIAADIFLLRMPALSGECAWVMTADEGVAKAKDYLMSYQEGESVYWQLHGDKPPFDTPYWRNTGNFLANVRESRKDKVFTDRKHGSLAPLVPKLEKLMAQFLQDKHLDNFGTMFVNNAGGVADIVIKH